MDEFSSHAFARFHQGQWFYDPFLSFLFLLLFYLNWGRALLLIGAMVLCCFKFSIMLG